MAGWTEAESAAALQWYAEERGRTVLTDVPLTGPNWRGWGADCRKRTATVAVSSDEPGVVTAFEEGTWMSALSGGGAVEPLLAWSGAGRYAYGHLATQKAFIERTWEPATPVRPVIVVATGNERPNTALSFDAAGFAIVPVAGEAPSRRGGGRGWANSKDPWEAPETGEDRSLQALWLQRDRRGWWLAEVPIGEGAPRRLDAVAIPWPEARHSPANADLEDFRVAVANGVEIELIEAKRGLNEETVGQLLGGAPMFSAEYPGHGELSLTACVRESEDEAMSWFCAQNEIRVDIVADRPSGAS